MSLLAFMHTYINMDPMQCFINETPGQSESTSLTACRFIRSKLQRVPRKVLTPIQSSSPSEVSKLAFNYHVAVNHSMFDDHGTSNFLHFNTHYTDDQFQVAFPDAAAPTDNEYHSIKSC